MKPLSKQDIIKVAVAAVVIILCVFAIYRVYAGSQLHVVQEINVPRGSSEKMQELKKQEQSQDASQPSTDQNKAMRNGNGDSPSDNIDPSKFKH